MVPCVAARGHSFKGAGLYYLHDKREDQEAERLTSDRVAWTHTHNLPTNDPEKGMKWMAYTSMNADALKDRAGVDKRGRKATAGAVYSYSLAWHPEQKPEKEEMLNASLSTIKELGLDDHQVVIVAHQETDHKHVHVICNLVHPETGKTAKISCDRLTLSEWAETYERDHGKVYCQNRAENNQKRKELAQEQQNSEELSQQFNDQAQEQGREETPKTGFVKHRGQKLDRAQRIQELYNQSDGGKAFKAALKQEGYHLAKGDRRGFVLVDDQGEVHSLSRQLKGQRAKDIKARLNDLDDVKPVKDVVETVMTYDRDAAEVKRQRELDEAANSKERKRQLAEKDKRALNTAPQENTLGKDGKEISLVDKQPPESKVEQGRGFEKEKPSVLDQLRIYQKHGYRSHAETFDVHVKWRENIDRETSKFEETLRQNYDRSPHLQKISELEGMLQKSTGIVSRLSGRRSKLEENLEAERRTLENLDSRIEEAKSAHTLKMEELYPEPDLKALEQERLDQKRLSMMEDFKRSIKEPDPQEEPPTPIERDQEKSPYEEQGPELDL